METSGAEVAHPVTGYPAPPRTWCRRPLRTLPALIGEEHREVLAAIRRLPDRQREVLVLRYYLDLDEAEIARSMGIGQSTVRSTTSAGTVPPDGSPPLRLPADAGLEQRRSRHGRQRAAGARWARLIAQVAVAAAVAAIAIAVPVLTRGGAARPGPRSRWSRPAGYRRTTCRSAPRSNRPWPRCGRRPPARSWAPCARRSRMRSSSPRRRPPMTGPLSWTPRHGPAIAGHGPARTCPGASSTCCGSPPTASRPGCGSFRYRFPRPDRDRGGSRLTCRGDTILVPDGSADICGELGMPGQATTTGFAEYSTTTGR
jgi:hypothetical protein